MFCFVLIEWRNSNTANREGYENGKENLVLEDVAVKNTIKNLNTIILQNTPDCVVNLFPNTINITPQVSIEPIYCSNEYLHKLEIKDYKFQSGLLCTLAQSRTEKLNE